jgi:hypothetical protein
VFGRGSHGVKQTRAVHHWTGEHKRLPRQFHPLITALGTQKKFAFLIIAFVKNAVLWNSLRLTCHRAVANRGSASSACARCLWGCRWYRWNKWTMPEQARRTRIHLQFLSKNKWQKNSFWF